MPKLLIETATGRVVNRIADPEEGWSPPTGHHIEPDDGRDISAPSAIVESVPAWAAKAVLEESGMLTFVEMAAENAGPDWKWRFRQAPTWHRANVLELQEDVGLSVAQIDDLLRRAAAKAG